jgi:hypothetical protein
MALLIFGKTQCGLCNRVLEQGEAVRSFPAFAVNEQDPLLLFSDGSFHQACLDADKRKNDVLYRVEELVANTGPGKRACAVCKAQVTDPDDYLLIGHLSDREADPLRQFNYTHLHKSCLPRWEKKELFGRLARAALTSRFWRGNYLNNLLKDLKL